MNEKAELEPVKQDSSGYDRGKEEQEVTLAHLKAETAGTESITKWRSTILCCSLTIGTLYIVFASCLLVWLLNNDSSRSEQAHVLSYLSQVPSGIAQASPTPTHRFASAQELSAIAQLLAQQQSVKQSPYVAIALIASIALVISMLLLGPSRALAPKDKDEAGATSALKVFLQAVKGTNGG